MEARNHHRCHPACAAFHSASIGVADDEAETGPQVTGYIQTHYNYPVGGGENRFRVQRARITVKGELNDRVSYEMDVDPRAPDHAGTLRDAFFNFRLDDHNVLRLGQQKVKFGYINQRSSSRLYAATTSNEYTDATM